MDQQEKEQQVAKLRQHRPWTEEDARFVLDACASSGETLEAFARRMKLVPQRLQWWRKRLGPGVGRGKAAVDEAPTFLPVVVRPVPAPSAPGEGGAVLVRGDVRLEVRELDARSAGWVATVMKSLQGEVWP